MYWGVVVRRHIDFVATIYCLAVLIFWSLGPIYIRYLVEWLDAWTQNALRYSVAALFWLPFVYWWSRTGRFDKRTWKRALAPAAANIIMQSMWAQAFYYLKPAFATLIIKSNVIWVAAFSLVFFAQERQLVRSGKFWVGLLLSAAGVSGVLVFEQDFSAEGTVTGVVVTLVVSVMWAAYMISAKIAFAEIDSRKGFGVVSLYTAVGLWVAALAFGDLHEALVMPARGWSAVVISGVLCIALAHALFYAAMRRIGVTIPTVVILAQPFTVLAISHFLFEEQLAAMQIVSGMVLLVGSTLAIWAQQHVGQKAAEE